MLLLFISFIAGILTALAPCVLPLLPVVVGGSVAGTRSWRRAAVIAVSLGTSVFIFTLALKATVALIVVPEVVWQISAGVIIALVGLALLAPGLWSRVPLIGRLYTGSNRLVGAGYQKHNILGDLIIGASLGPVFSSCSPTYFVVLAAVLPVDLVAGVLDIFAYCIGLAIALFVIAILGQRVALMLGAQGGVQLSRAVGVVFVIIGIAVAFGLDKQFEARLPASAFGITQIDQTLLSLTGSGSSTPIISETGAFLSPAQKAAKGLHLAPELQGVDGYINTGGKPIDLAQYRGKDVVLVDFWTYSCINCLRTLPYLEAWYQKYKDEGLVVIGVHTPEFAFEHVLSNVENAVKADGIKYPVVLDNEYKTWNAFGNEYWPQEYLIDIDGYIVDSHSGEGNYDTTEQAIQRALAERAARLNLSTSTLATSSVNVPQDDLSAIESPETYFGSNRNEYLGNGAPGTPGVQQFSLPNAGNVEPNTLYLGGSWDIEPEYAEATASGDEVQFYYSAHDIYLVGAASDPSHPVEVEVLLDGKPVGQYAGADVDPTTSQVQIGADRLYKLVHDPAAGAHIITLVVKSPGLEAYTFTFG